MEASFHRAIKKIGEDIETLKFNTAIATLMALLNDIYDIGSVTKGELDLFTVLFEICLRPIFVKKYGSILSSAMVWFVSSNGLNNIESKCVDKTIENTGCAGIRKNSLQIGSCGNIDAESAIAAAKADAKVAAELSGKQFVKEIYVPG